MRLENIWISPYMFLHFALITTYICVGTWTQSYHALVLPADTLYSWMYSLFPEYFLLMTKFSFQMRHDTVKPILNGHTIDSNLFCFRQLPVSQVYSTLWHWCMTSTKFSMYCRVEWQKTGSQRPCDVPARDFVNLCICAAAFVLRHLCCGLIQLNVFTFWGILPSND